MPNFRFQISERKFDFDCRFSSFDFRLLNFEFRVSNFDFRASIFEFRFSNSSLPLLVLRVLADHPHHTAAAYDLALRTDPLYRRTNFHFFLAPRRKSERRQFQIPDSKFKTIGSDFPVSIFEFRFWNSDFPIFTCTGTRSGRASGRTEKAPRRPYPRAEFG